MPLWGDDGCRAPGAYALEIERLRTREERSAALARVPGHLREIVRLQVVGDLEILNAWAARVRAGLPLEQVPAPVLAAAVALGRPL